MERTTKFLPAFHKVHEDPTKNYGVGSVRVFMALTGEKGAITFSFGTGQYLEKTYQWWKSRGLHKDVNDCHDHMGYDVSTHSLIPMYEGQMSRPNCEFLGGKTCYSDGSSLVADQWEKILIEKGSDKIWKMMEERYAEEFNK